VFDHALEVMGFAFWLESYRVCFLCKIYVEIMGIKGRVIV